MAVLLPCTPPFTLRHHEDKWILHASLRSIARADITHFDHDGDAVFFELGQLNDTDMEALEKALRLGVERLQRTEGYSALHTIRAEAMLAAVEKFNRG